MSTWQDVTAGPGGLVGVGSGWSSTAWLVAGAVAALLALIAWWIAGPSRARRRGRGEELALRRYELRGHTARGRPTRPGGLRRNGGGSPGTGNDDTSRETKGY